MADPIPAGPDEAANRARVQAIAQGGMQAAQQAPSIATAPEAMQTAMARSAGVNAPDLFNATQMATIQNPFTRGDAQLAADQAGAGGVLGSINSSTADYLQKASGGVDIQREITRRIYQQLAQQHEQDAEELSFAREKIAHEREAWTRQNDPNSLDYKIAQKEKERKWAELNAKPLATSASSSKDVQSRTGETTATQKQITNQPWYNSQVMRGDDMGIVDSVIKAKGDTSMLRSSIADGIATGNAVWQAEIDAGNENPGSNPLALNPANNALTSAQIYAQYAPMFPNFDETNIDSANFAQWAFDNAPTGAGSPASPGAPASPTGVLRQQVAAHSGSPTIGAMQQQVAAHYGSPTAAAMQQQVAAHNGAGVSPVNAALQQQVAQHYGSPTAAAMQQQVAAHEGSVAPPITMVSGVDAKRLAKLAADAKKPSRGKSKKKK